jgi:hypothetical protein
MVFLTIRFYKTTMLFITIIARYLLHELVHINPHAYPCKSHELLFESALLFSLIPFLFKEHFLRSRGERGITHSAMAELVNFVSNPPPPRLHRGFCSNPHYFSVSSRFYSKSTF